MKKVTSFCFFVFLATVLASSCHHSKSLKGIEPKKEKAKNGSLSVCETYERQCKEILDVVKTQFITDGMPHFANKNEANSYLSKHLKNYLSQRYSFNNAEQLKIDSLAITYKDFVQMATSNFTSGMNFDKIKILLQKLHDDASIDDFEYQIGLQLIDLSHQLSIKQINKTTLSTKIDSLKLCYTAQEYPNDFTRGSFAGLVLGVSSATNQWYISNQAFIEANPDFELLMGDNTIEMALSIIGAIIAGLGAFFGKANWGLVIMIAVGIAAVFGASAIGG